VNKLLLVAFHFPPQVGSSGLLRSLKFSRNLLAHNWRATVLTAKTRAYEKLDPSQLSQVPPEVKVVRAFALDTKRHLSMGGRYLDTFALPDRWVTWALGAIPAGLRIIRRQKIDVIFSTFPVATAILIGWNLHRLTGRPWIADFRDLMTEDDYPVDPRTRRVYRSLEQKAVRHAARIIFTAPSAVEEYLKRYPELRREKCVVIANGYEEQDFQGIATENSAASRSPSAPLRLVHNGLIYPQERDPRPFFRALSRLKREGHLDPTLQIDLRASGSDDLYAKMLAELELTDVVKLLPAVPYRQSLKESAAADGLLLLQSAWCSRQIPAKAYEYLRLRRPILALTNTNGDTGRLLNETGGATIAALEDEEAIYRALPEFLNALRAGSHPLPDPQISARFSRREQAAELARVLDQVLAESKQAKS
jgi:glycosyltransferase involved in cell wall biosynthesis